MREWIGVTFADVVLKVLSVVSPRSVRSRKSDSHTNHAHIVTAFDSFTF